jgi:hypothetical protein
MSLFEAYEPTGFDMFLEGLEGFRPQPTDSPAVAGLQGIIAGLGQASAAKRARAEKKWMDLQRQMAMTEFAARQEQAGLQRQRALQDIEKAEIELGKLRGTNRPGEHIANITDPSGNNVPVYIIESGPDAGMFSTLARENPSVAIPMTTAQLNALAANANRAAVRTQNIEVNSAAYESQYRDRIEQGGLLDDLSPEQQRQFEIGRGIAEANFTPSQYAAHMDRFVKHRSEGGAQIEQWADPILYEQAANIEAGARSRLKQASEGLETLSSSQFERFATYNFGMLPRAFAPLLASKPNIRRWTNADIKTAQPNNTELQAQAIGIVRLFKEEEARLNDQIQRENYVIAGRRQHGQDANIWEHDSTMRTRDPRQSALHQIIQVFNIDHEDVFDFNEAVHLVKQTGRDDFGWDMDAPGVDEYVKQELFDHPRFRDIAVEAMGGDGLMGEITGESGAKPKPAAEEPGGAVPPGMDVSLIDNETLKKWAEEASVIAGRTVSIEEARKRLEAGNPP